MKKIVRWLILAGGIILLLCLGFMIYKSWTVKATLKTSVVAITAQNQKLTRQVRKSLQMILKCWKSMKTENP